MSDKVTGTEDILQVKNDILHNLIKRPVPLSHLIFFTRQMKALVRSGVPIIQAIKGLANQTPSKRLSDVLNDVHYKLSSGISFTDALAHYPDVFDNIYVSMVMVGENTGEMDLAFERLIDYLEFEKKTKNQFAKAMIYPTIVMFFMAIAFLIITTVVLPKFAKFYKRFDGNLPFLTDSVLTLSNFLTQNYLLISLGGLFLIFAFSAFRQSQGGRLAIDRFKVKLPILGNLFQQMAMTRYCRIFAMLYQAGIPVVQSIRISGRAMSNQYLSNKVNLLAAKVEKGDSLLNASVASNIFNFLVLQMLSVGEESGEVERLLVDVADYYDEEIGLSLDKISMLLTVILMILMAFLVFLMMAAVYLPIMDLSNQISSYR